MVLTWTQKPHPSFIKTQSSPRESEEEDENGARYDTLSLPHPLFLQVLSSRVSHQIPLKTHSSLRLFFSHSGHRTRVPMLLLCRHRGHFSFCKVKILPLTALVSKYAFSVEFLIQFLSTLILLIAGNVWSLEFSLQVQFTQETISALSKIGSLFRFFLFSSQFVSISICNIHQI